MTFWPPSNQHSALRIAAKSKAKVLSDAGISKDQAHRAEKIAEIPEAEFERRVEKAAGKPIKN